MRIVAVDPGQLESAHVIYDSVGHILDRGISPNGLLLNWLSDGVHRGNLRPGHLAIEMVASYGMPVGAETFETCVWIGRFVQAWRAPHSLVYRKDVKLHLCGQTRAKDSNVRQALIDRFGGKQAIRKGGVLHGVAGDIWSALAVAVTYVDRVCAASVCWGGE